MTIIIHIDHPDRDPQAIKECLAMDCERYGRGVRVVDVYEEYAEQTKMWEDKT